MEQSNLMDITLPNGEVVKVSSAEEAWWTLPNTHGYVSPRFLAPDPKQPRQHIDPAKLKELKDSIEAEGIRDELVVTPLSHALWMKPDHRAHPEAFFAIVSGHRRTEVAMDIGLKAVPINVRLYPSEAKHRVDAIILNVGREDLTPLEEGYQIQELTNDGMNLNQAAKALGKNYVWVRGRHALTRLAPDIQELLDASKKEKKRLQTVIATELGLLDSPSVELLLVLLKESGDHSTNPSAMTEGERRFSLQGVLLKEIRRRQLGVVRALSHIKEAVHGKILPGTPRSGDGAIQALAIRFEPRKRRQIIRNLVVGVDNSVVFDWKLEDWGAIFEHAESGEIKVLLEKSKGAHSNLGTLVKLLESIATKKRAEGPAPPSPPPPVPKAEEPRGRAVGAAPVLIPPPLPPPVLDPPPPEEDSEEELPEVELDDPLDDELPDNEPESDEEEGAEREGKDKPARPSQDHPWRQTAAGRPPRWSNPPPRKPPFPPQGNVTQADGFKPFTAVTFNPKTGELELTKVEETKQFEELFGEKRFEWQRKGTKPPANFPKLPEAKGKQKRK